MFGYAYSEDYQPLFYVRGRPIHVTALLVILHCLALIVCCMAPALLGVNLWSRINFSSEDVLRHGMVWEAVTYLFSHLPSIWFLFDMAFLFIWGREVERFFGRTTFCWLYGGLAAVAPVFLTARGLLQGGNQYLAYSRMDGSVYVHIGLFVVFATLYPSVQFFFGVASTWIATAIVAIMLLQCMAAQLVNDGLVLALIVVVAFFGTRYAKVGSEAFGPLANWRPRLSRKPVAVAGLKPRLKPRRAVDAGGGGGDDYRDRDVHESIDPLLDKISKQGIGSLTSSERATLEQARVSLLKKERGD